VRFVERGHDWHELVLVRELYREGRVVFLVRDLRDLLASRLAFNRKTGRAQFGYGGAASPEDYVRTTMRTEVGDLLDTWRARGTDGFLLRYEDLVQRPREVLRDLLAAAGLDASAETVTATLERARARRPERQAGHKTSPDESASIGRWRDDLAPSLQQACAEAFGEALAAFGYEPARNL
jgi:hypothetical protein